MECTCYSCETLMRINFSRQIFEISSNIKFYVNPSSCSWVVPWGQANRQTDRQTYMMKRMFTFWTYVSVPKVVLKEVECEGLNWLLVSDRVCWWVVVNSVVDVQFASKTGNFLTRWANVSLWRRLWCYKFLLQVGMVVMVHTAMQINHEQCFESRGWHSATLCTLQCCYGCNFL